MSIDTFAINDNHRHNLPTLDMPPRILLGAGPSNSHPRVLNAMLAPTVGHLDPTLIAVMGEISELLRYAWQTDNEYTIAISGTGSSGMEAVSYTHLDVYKRQKIGSAPPWHASACRRPSSPCTSRLARATRR